MSPPPANPRIYHILHVDRLQSVLQDGCLYSDAIMQTRQGAGTTIGLSGIKRRRLRHALASRPGLSVGECVPFYFCPRSIMLYVLHMGNMEGLTYTGGQRPIVHLELDLHTVVAWCGNQGLRWAFTLSNAGAAYFEDRCQISQLNEINWEAVRATQWSHPDVKEGKQAELLVQNNVDWSLVNQIGVKDQSILTRVHGMLNAVGHRPQVVIEPSWYY